MEGWEERQNEEGREKLVAKGGVTRIVASGCQTSEMEADLLSADVDDRRVTEDAAVAGSVLTRKAMEVSINNEAGRKAFFSVDGEVNQVQGSMGSEEVTAVELFTISKCKKKLLFV